MNWMLGSEGKEVKFNCYIFNKKLIDGSVIYKEELRRRSLGEVMGWRISLVCYINEIFRRRGEVNFN